SLALRTARADFPLSSHPKASWLPQGLALRIGRVSSSTRCSSFLSPLLAQPAQKAERALVVEAAEAVTTEMAVEAATADPPNARTRPGEPAISTPCAIAWAIPNAPCNA